MHHWHAPTLQAEDAPTLRPRRNLERLLAIQRRHLDLRPQRRVSEADRQVVEDISALAFEILMRLDAERDVEIAWCATTWWHLTLAGDPHVDAIVHPRWDVDCHPAHVAHAPL